jgi:acyl carrier protein
VKIRGFRVEAGEVEAVLRQHPQVQQAAVVFREDVPGDARLVAYWVSQFVPPAPDEELRSFLLERLPAYMVPPVFVALDRLPLTPNGKLDRAALPVPEEAVTAGRREFVAPRDEIEAVVAGIWAELLGLEQVGVDDDFFELGGHSLLATQVIARLRAESGVQLPVHTLFTTPTVAGLAAVVAGARDDARTDDDEVARLIAELDELSDEEAERLLAVELEQAGEDR